MFLRLYQNLFVKFKKIMPDIEDLFFIHNF